jgi:hypothetical protein
MGYVNLTKKVLFHLCGFLSSSKIANNKTIITPAHIIPNPQAATPARGQSIETFLFFDSAMKAIPRKIKSIAIIDDIILISVVVLNV